jgi:hypothetical protein
MQPCPLSKTVNGYMTVTFNRDTVVNRERVHRLEPSVHRFVKLIQRRILFGQFIGDDFYYIISHVFGANHSPLPSGLWFGVVRLLFGISS